MQRINLKNLGRSKSLLDLKFLPSYRVEKEKNRKAEKRVAENDEVFDINWMMLVDHEIFETEVTVRRILEKEAVIVKLDSLGAMQTFDLSNEIYIEKLEVGMIYGTLITPKSLTQFSAQGVGEKGKLDLSQSLLLTEKTICLGLDYCKSNVILPENLNL